MRFLEAIFLLSMACFGYTYFGYPGLLAICPRRNTAKSGDDTQSASVSVVLVVRNEEAQIERRVFELTTLLQSIVAPSELIVVSDGSSDKTVVLTRQIAGRDSDNSLVLIDLLEPVGKAAALSVGCGQAKHSIIVFADARQRWSSDSIPRLLEPFASAEVGAVSGELVLETARGVLAGVSLYWRFEKWLRQAESQIWSQIGVTGAIAAVRRELFTPIPAGTLLDDVYWPLCVAMAGYRVIHEPRAKAYDWLPEVASGEFRRKVRTLSGNFQLLVRLPSALLPWRNPVWLFFVSHKVLRIVAPWMILTSLCSSACLAILREGAGSVVYGSLFVAGTLLLLTGVLGMISARAARSRVVSAIAAFLLLHLAAWWAFWVWVTGRANRSWSKVQHVATSTGFV